jgi:hypothetical protein
MKHGIPYYLFPDFDSGHFPLHTLCSQPCDFHTVPGTLAEQPIFLSIDDTLSGHCMVSLLLSFLVYQLQFTGRGKLDENRRQAGL